LIRLKWAGVRPDIQKAVLRFARTSSATLVDDGDRYHHRHPQPVLLADVSISTSAVLALSVSTIVSTTTDRTSFEEAAGLIGVCFAYLVEGHGPLARIGHARREDVSLFNGLWLPRKPRPFSGVRLFTLWQLLFECASRRSSRCAVLEAVLACTIAVDLKVFRPTRSAPA